MKHSSASLLQKIATHSARINETIGRLVAWLTVGMVIVTFLIVVLRYAFNTGWIAMQESVTYMHACVFLLGAAYTLKHNGHVRVDIFYREMSAKRQAIVDLFGSVFFLLPVAGLIFWSSWDYVRDAWVLKESSQDAGGIPAVYLLKSTLVIMPALLIVQAMSDALQNIVTLTGNESKPNPEKFRGCV